MNIININVCITAVPAFTTPISQDTSPLRTPFIEPYS